MNPLAGLPLDYLIGKDGATVGQAKRIAEVAYDIETPPPVGLSVAYCNLLDERNEGRFPPYREQTPTAKQYDEGVPDATGPGFEANLREQFARRKAQGFRYVELDNPDAYTVADILRATRWAEDYDLGVIAKNPLAMDEVATAWLIHPNVFGVIVEKDAGTPDQMQVMRTASGKPDLPIWYVFFGDGLAAARACAIRAGRFSNMGVTYDGAAEEYGGEVQDFLLPISQTREPSMAVTGADILARARSYIGKLFDGPDVVMQARAIAQVFPDLAPYCAEATNGMPWCGDFVEFILKDFGIRPPAVKDGVGFFFVDRWLDWGMPIPLGQGRPGDVAIFLGNPHHVTFVAGGGKYVGGNQFRASSGESDAVTETTFRTPDAIRRASSADSIVTPPPARPASSNFDKCLPLLLEHEGGNDDDPRDPGGRTSRGILQSEWDKWRQTHPGLPSDVWQAPQDQVAAIYREKYWDALECDALPSGVDYAVFDYGVNSGIGRSAKVLQRIVIPQEVDGEIGPNTIAAALRVDPRTLIGQICDERLAFLQGLSTWSTFGNGWGRRVSEVRANALVMAATPKEPTMSKAPDPGSVAILDPLKGDALRDLLMQLAPVILAILQQVAAGQSPKLPPSLPPPKQADPVAASTAPATLTGAIGTIGGIVGKVLPILGLQGTAWGTAILWALQAWDVVGTAGGATATPTGGAVTAGLVGTGLSSVVAMIGRFLNNRQPTQ